MKRYTALFTAILFVLVFAGGGVVSLFSFANAAVNPTYEVPYNTTFDVNNALQIYDFSYNNLQSEYLYNKRNSDAIVTACGYLNSNNYKNIVIVSTQSMLIDFVITKNDGSSSSTDWLNVNQTYTYNGVTYYYYNNRPANVDNSYISYTVPYYTDLDSAIIACINAMDYTPPRPTYTYNFTIPAGYAAFIEYEDDIDISMNAQMYDLSTLWISGPQPGFWPQDFAQIGSYSNLPSIGDTFDNTGFNKIPWERGTDRNLLNQTKTAVYTDTIFYNNIPYAVIYNPAYYISDLNSGEVKLSPTINITVENAVSVALISILQGAINNVDDLQVNSSNNVEPDGTVVDSDDNPVNLPDGGGNYVPSNSDMTSTIGKLVSDIDEFFNGTWRYIRQLVESIGTFPQFIVQLYSWLPMEFKGVLFSAFSVVVVVAVLKVML